MKDNGGGRVDGLGDIGYIALSSVTYVSVTHVNLKVFIDNITNLVTELIRQYKTV